jgi:hypothetical protein
MAKCDDEDHNPSKDIQGETRYPESDPDPLKPGHDEDALTLCQKVCARLREASAYLKWLVCC